MFFASVGVKTVGVGWLGNGGSLGRKGFRPVVEGCAEEGYGCLLDGHFYFGYFVYICV